MAKLEKIRKQLKNQGLDALLITNPFNRRYLSGFTGSSGTLLVSLEEAILFTDFRYIEQATNETNLFEIVEHKGSLLSEITNQLNKYNIKRLGFEENDVSFKQFTQFNHTFDVELIPTSDIVENELLILQEAAKIADNAFSEILNYIKPGVKEIDVSNELE